MAEILRLNKQVYSKNQYEKVIDTKFSQLATTITPSTTETKSLEENYTEEINKFIRVITLEANLIILHVNY